MLTLSKRTIQMSKYVRDGQKQEWYNEPIYRVYQKKVDNFETALNLAQQLQV